jgi:hypothetical protein
MKKDDLTHIKYIGPSRLKKLNEHGITTIEQLQNIPVRELAKITSIGEYYSIRIKEAAVAFGAQQSAGAVKATVQTTKKPPGIAKKTKKSLRKLTNRLNRAKENLKPLWKKKYLGLYIDFKKQSNKLIGRIKKIENNFHALSDPEMAEIISQSESLKRRLKTDGKKPKKKAFKNLTQEIKSFSGKLKKHKS